MKQDTRTQNILGYKLTFIELLLPLGSIQALRQFQGGENRIGFEGLVMMGNTAYSQHCVLIMNPV